MRLNLLALFSFALASTELCQEALLTALNSSAAFLLKQSENSADLAMMSYSGKAPNDLGHYRSCLSMSDSNYLTIDIRGAGFIFGFCAPKDCTKYDISSLLYNELIKNENLKGISESIYIHDTELYSLGFEGSVVVFLIITSLSLSLIASYFDIIKDNEDLPSLKTHIEPKMTLLGCFSLYNNIKKLFASRSADESSATKGLEVLNGVRVLSISWVIYGHVFFFRAVSPIVNPQDIIPLMKQPYYTLSYGGFFAVDTFFWLSGFLMCYLTYQEVERRSGNTPMSFWGIFYLHRYLRLLPLYAFCIAFYVFVLPTLGSGPFWYKMEEMNQECRSYWWTNLFYINNFYPDGLGNSCFGIGWYLANDMQFFLISPAFIVLYYRHPKFLTWIALGTASALSILVTCLIVDEYDFNPVVLAMENLVNDFHRIVYTKPYCRIVPYLLGVLVGFVYIQYLKSAKGEPVTDSTAKTVLDFYKNNDKRSYASLITGVALVIFLVFIQVQAYSSGPNWDAWSHSTNVLFMGFSRPLFTIGLILILLPVLLNKLPFMLTILGNKYWTPLARLSFACFMGHSAAMMFNINSEVNARVLNTLLFARDYPGALLSSFAVGLPLSLLIEVPFMNIEKYSRSGRKCAKKV